MRPLALFRTANFKLAATYALLFSVSVSLLAAVVYYRTTDEFRTQERLRITAEAATLQQIYRTNGLEELLASVHDRQSNRTLGGLGYAIFETNGTRVFGTLERVPLRVGWSDAVGPPDGDEAPGQLETLVVYTAPLSPTLRLAIAADFGRFDRFGTVILQTFGWIALPTLLLAIFGGLALSAGVLGRIEAITRTAEAIIGGDIHQRIPSLKTGDELDRLSATLNRMLDRIAQLMDSLRQVSNNIAHDLRTPLSHLRQTLDESRENARSMTDYEAAVTNAIGETDAVLETFSALLRIAQIEAGTRRSAFQDVELRSVVDGIAQTYAAIAEDLGKHLTTHVESSSVVRGDSELLTQLLVNLVENALRHTPEGTEINILLRHIESPELVISDNGPGIPASEREKVFERFHRLEASRTTAGSGLGLSIVSAIAELHDIRVVLEDNRPGLRVRLIFLRDSRAELPVVQESANRERQRLPA